LGKYTLKNLEVKLAFNGNVPCSITGTGLIVSRNGGGTGEPPPVNCLES
jgi:hypothetical protein